MSDECFKEDQTFDKNERTAESKVSNHDPVFKKPTLPTFNHYLELLYSERIDERIPAINNLIKCVTEGEYDLFLESNAADVLAEVVEVTYQAKTKFLPRKFFILICCLASHEECLPIFTDNLLGAVFSSYDEIAKKDINGALVLRMMTKLNDFEYPPLVEGITGDFIQRVFEQLGRSIESASEDEPKEATLFRENQLLFISSLVRKLFRNQEEFDSIYESLMESVRDAMNKSIPQCSILAFKTICSIIKKETPDDVCNDIIEKFGMDITTALDVEENLECREYLFDIISSLAFSHESVLKTFCCFIGKETNPEPINEFSFLLATLCNCDEMDILITVAKSPWLPAIFERSSEISFKNKGFLLQSITGLINTKEHALIKEIISPDLILFIPSVLDGLPRQLIKSAFQSLSIVKKYLDETKNEMVAVFDDEDFVSLISDLTFEDEELESLSKEFINEDEDDGD